MGFLTGQNRVVAEEAQTLAISAAHEHVIVIGGGDTGSDCIGTSHRQGAATVVNFELLPQPTEERPEGQPWPFWPMRLRTSSSHEEGGERHWNILTKRFIGEQGTVTALGFVGPEPDTVVAQLDLRLDERGNLATASGCMTSKRGVFAAGDARRGQSLIVWAISEGRETARHVDLFLMGKSALPAKPCCDLPRV
jgi:glutamate synthase (NADPH/NADH) small chain